MKTLEEIKEHLSTTVYDEDSKQRIAGFLIGKEIGKEEGALDIEFALPKSFEEFGEWFNDSSKNYFQRKDDIVNDEVVPDDILEKILKVFFGEKEPKYKYTGEERENLIKYREKFQYAISELKNEYIGSLINNDCFSSLIYRDYIDNYTRCLKNIEDKLNETVD